MPVSNSPNGRKKKTKLRATKQYLVADAGETSSSQPASDREVHSSNPSSPRAQPQRQPDQPVSVEPSPQIPLISLDYSDTESQPPPQPPPDPGIQPIAHVDEGNKVEGLMDEQLRNFTGMEWSQTGIEPKDEPEPESPPANGFTSPPLRALDTCYAPSSPGPQSPDPLPIPAPTLSLASAPVSEISSPPPPLRQTREAPARGTLSPLVPDAAELEADVPASLRLWEEDADIQIDVESPNDARVLEGQVGRRRAPEREAVEDEHHDEEDHGVPAHTRSPVLTRPPTMLENISRTVRGYVPSSVSMSIPVPSGAPSPPLVSRPVSFGSFLPGARDQDGGETRGGNRSGGDGARMGARDGRGVGRSDARRTSVGGAYREHEEAHEEPYAYPREHEHEHDGYARGNALPHPFDGDRHARASTSGAGPSMGYGYGAGYGDVGYGAGVGVGVGAGAGAGRRATGPSGLTTTYPRAPSSIGGAYGSGAGAGAEGAIGGKGAGFGGYDAIVWSRWDLLGDRRILILGYASPSGLQIWDCADLGSIRELLNLGGRSDEAGYGSPPRGAVRPVSENEVTAWGQVSFAAVLPTPAPHSTPKDGLAAHRPVVGVVTSIEEEKVLLVYSLRTHRVVCRLPYAGLYDFQANDKFVVLATQSPPTLHVLSAATLAPLTTVSSTSLAAFAPSTSSTFNLLPSHRTSVSISHIDSSDYNSNALNINLNASITSNTTSYTQNNNSTSSADPYPVYALSGRLLAYASPPPRTADALYGAATTPTSRKLSVTSPSLSAFANVTSGGVSSSGNTSASAAAATAALVQAELGSAARKVGGSVLSGMRSLGGMAYAAALSKAGLTPAAAAPATTGGVGGLGAATNRFFSRSAPAASASPTEGSGRGRRYSTASTAGAAGDESAPGDSGSPGGVAQRREGGIEPVTGGSGERGYFVTVVDLAPLLRVSGDKQLQRGATQATQPSASLTVISEFQASRHQRIAGLHFSPDGTELLVVPKDGQTAQTFKIRPVPTPRRAVWARMIARGDGALVDGDGLSHLPTSPSAAAAASPTAASPLGLTGQAAPVSSGVVPQEPPLHAYDLRRGRTSAIVQGMSWAVDGRWIAFGTWNRTVHVFPVNPYGGKPDVRSHMEGVVKNVADVQPLSVEVKALARLHIGKAVAPGQPKLPLAFTFVQASDAVPTNLRFAPATSPPQSVMRYGSAGSSNTTTDYTEPLASPRRRSAGNFQDVLLFDPMDGSLVLQRIVVSVERGEGRLSTPVQQSLSALGVTSRSAPRMGAAGPLTSSPPGTGSGMSSGEVGTTRSRAMSSLSRMMDAAPSLSPQGEERLAGKDSQIAYWNLRRSRDWGEVRKSVSEDANSRVKENRRRSADWHAQAELTTHSKSRGLLHRSIYLSHQFSFHTLGEDYHALIRRFKFDIGGAKIEFRKEVEASIAAGGGGESFVEGFTGPSSLRRGSSSFDEPLASALAGGLNYTTTSPVLPMLPNGAPGSNPKSFRNSIPIRVLSDNVSEGFGRIRREIQGRRIRSPRLAQGSAIATDGSVPLEFDEEDEDFLLAGHAGGMVGRSESVVSRSRGTSRGGAGSSATVSTPATSTHPLDEEGDKAVDRGGIMVEAGVAEGDGEDDDLWGRWENEDKLAVEEAERFDDISVVGFLDEEMRDTRGTTRGRARKHAR